MPQSFVLFRAFALGSLPVAHATEVRTSRPSASELVALRARALGVCPWLLPLRFRNLEALCL